MNEPELSPRELAVTFTDTKGYFVSESSVCRLLKAHDLITSPAFIVIKAADEFHDKTTAPNQPWQTDFTYLKVIGWGGSTCRPCSTTSRATSSPEAVPHDEGRGRHRHADYGAHSIRLRQRQDVALNRPGFTGGRFV